MVKVGDLGAIVERKKLSQWFFNISKFSQDLLDGLENWKIGQIKLKLCKKIGLVNLLDVKLNLK